jgi:hypothetical protein
LACKATRFFSALPGTSSARSRWSLFTVWTRTEPGHFLAAVAQHPQRIELTVAAQDAQDAEGRGADCDDRDRVRVAGIGLAVVAGVEQPGSGGEFGRHVHNVLAGLEQTLGQRSAGTVAALDGSDPFGPVLRVSPHRGVAATVSAEPARAEESLVSVDDLDGGRQLMGSTPMITFLIAFSCYASCR